MVSVVLAMQRRHFLGTAGASLLQRQSRPNILFIAADDLNIDVGCYGHPIVQTPNLDALAARGVRFSRAYCQFPVCNPSRTSLLSGRYPERTGVLDNRMNPRANMPNVPFLPEHLRRNGYFTAQIGKIFHDGMAGPDDWDLKLDPRPGSKIGRQGEGRNLTGGKLPYLEVRAAEGGDEDQPDGLIAAETIRLIEERRPQPWFIATGFRKPHDPYIAPKRYFENYPMEKIGITPGPADDRSDIPPMAYPNPRKDLEEPEGREYKRAYYACVSFMDAQLGKVLSALERNPAASNTIVVFFGDNGLHLGEHGWWNKVTLFERSAHIPLMISTPWMKNQGAVCRRPVELMSLYPTLMELAGLKCPSTVESESVAELLRNPDAPWRRPAYCVVTRGQGALGRAVYTERYRYTEWDEGKGGVELYDHESDPHEYRNLSGKQDYSSIEASLKRQLAAIRPAKPGN
jgi:uncharacterized sulfatase